MQGENGYFMALDMDTGEVCMKPPHGFDKNQQVQTQNSNTDIQIALLLLLCDGSPCDGL